MRPNLSLFALLIILAPNSIQAQELNSNQAPLFRIRTVTAGVNLNSISDSETLESAMAFLNRAKKAYETAGYEVQTLRIATQPLGEYLQGHSLNDAISELKKIDRLLTSRNVLLSVGPVITTDRYDPDLPRWASSLIQATNNISFNVSVASNEEGLHPQAVRSAAETIVAISKASKGGEGNFRFTATANSPPDIPFFPAAYHRGTPSFAVGLESPGLLKQAFKSVGSMEDAKRQLKSLMETKLAMVEKVAMKIAERENRSYSGIDVSPAPGLDASIGEAIEMLTRVPFGDTSTLRACAAITDVLKNLQIKKCGFSGLMLPVIEDKVLARRATEGRYSVQELLLYSSVSGTGLDVVPLPGDMPVDAVASLISDLAALSIKLSNKPLSARLFLIPGKKAGEMVKFDNPYLTDCAVMAID